MKKVILAALALTPVIASAQQLSQLQQLLQSIGTLVRMAIPIVVGIALLVFFWGLVKFIFNAGDDTARAEGKKLMIWGIIGFFVMISIWGLVGFINNSLGIQPIQQPIVPTVPGI